MDTVVYDRIEDVLGRIESLYGRVEDTYLVAKDILLGTQIGDWIADLKASGTASATYGDEERMNILIANEDAAKNQDVAKYLVQWAAANNKYGTYCGAACGAVSGVTWDRLTTPNAVMSNATAFTALCGNSTAIYETLNVKSCRQAIWSNLSICDSIIRSNNTSLKAMQSLCKSSYKIESSYGTPLSGKYFLYYLQCHNNSNTFSAKLIYAPENAEETIPMSGYGNKDIVNRFVTYGESIGVASIPACALDFS